jgi:hypothetical protein
MRDSRCLILSLYAVATLVCCAPMLTVVRLAGLSQAKLAARHSSVVASQVWQSAAPLWDELPTVPSLPQFRPTLPSAPQTAARSAATRLVVSARSTAADLADSTWQTANRLADSTRQAAARAIVSARTRATKSNGLWLTDYAKAMTIADRQGKMLLIYFCDTSDGGPCKRFQAETLDDPAVRRKLQDYVCVRLPLAAKIRVEGKEVSLLDHEAFQEMLGKPGIAILDFRTADATLRGSVVSAFPLTDSLWYTPEQMAVILNLPPGTLTQRTLIFAVRTHPERPASTDGELLPALSEEAQSHSQYQADIRVQGHHSWGSRFARIVARLPGGLSAREVCAESWPGQHLVEAAIECVHSWRQSSGHWGAVRSQQPFFGYDMKLGDNGVWYATGIFGGG